MTKDDVEARSNFNNPGLSIYTHCIKEEVPAPFLFIKSTISVLF